VPLRLADQLALFDFQDAAARPAEMAMLDLKADP